MSHGVEVSGAPAGPLTDLPAVLAEARALARLAESTGGDAWPGVAERLRSSVIRPLAGALGERLDLPATAPGAQADTPPSWARLWALVRAATRLRGDPAASSALVEATAALQDLVIRWPGLTGPDPAGSDDDRTVEDRTSELAELQGGAPDGIRVSQDGPYLVTGSVEVTDHLGIRVAATPTMALCRCGASARKPWCDGAHATTGFSGAKDPHRVPDRRDSYPGVRATVLDNRGICQHSGLCTDRLPTAFHAGSEPFVTASGGRMDEITEAARRCPSGALSFAVDGREAREQVDQAERAPAIEITLDGPYRVTGGLAVTDDHGDPEPRAAGASAEHCALCRCGHSQNKPFCSGMHYYVGFADPPPPDEPTLFEWAGGFPALLRMTEIFYSKYVPADPLLSPLFAAMSPDHPQRVAAWLGEVFGGPSNYSDRYGGYSQMISHHVGKCLTEQQRARWVSLLGKSANDAQLPNDAEFRAAFTAYLEWGSRLAVENSQTQARPPEGMPMPHWWWVCNATPGSRISALAPPAEPEQPLPLPGPDQALSFAEHIKPLFRPQDRNSMRFAFDLWSHADVSAHAEAILERLRAGSMPCDGAWPTERTDVFARWVALGSPE